METNYLNMHFSAEKKLAKEKNKLRINNMHDTINDINNDINLPEKFKGKPFTRFAFEQMKNQVYAPKKRKIENDLSLEFRFKNSKCVRNLFKSDLTEYTTPTKYENSLVAPNAPKKKLLEKFYDENDISCAKKLFE